MPAEAAPIDDEDDAFDLWAFLAWCFVPMLPDAPAIGLSEDIGVEAA